MLGSLSLNYWFLCIYLHFSLGVVGVFAQTVTIRISIYANIGPSNTCPYVEIPLYLQTECYERKTLMHNGIQG